MRATLVAVLMVAAGCAGEGPSPSPDGGGADVSAVDQGPPADQGPACSATGVSASCDPIAASGCSEGSCYVTKNVGASCVCPAGSAATGDDCNTTTDCAPGNVCAGTAAPGTCRATCDPNDDQCGSGMKCTFLQAFNQFGYCEPE